VRCNIGRKFGERAFSFAALNAWNKLPYERKRITNAATFKNI